MNGISGYFLKLFSFIQIFLLILILWYSETQAQIGLSLHSNRSAKQFSDTTAIAFTRPLLPLRNWQIMNDQYIQVENESKGLNVYNYISPDYIPRNPFELDLRYTSNYVPGDVRDELNLMMNRPRDSAFLPILPVAFIALQLASQHLLISRKTEITGENIIQSKAALPVLKALWRESPQTMAQLYKNDDLINKFTMQHLERMLALLIENKLVRTREIENAETKYFFAIDKKQYDEIVNRANAQKMVIPELNPRK